MIRHLRILLAALSAFSVIAICSSALANDGMCPSNDRKLPDKSTVCRQGTLWVCEAGQWKSLGVKCSF
jgi:hypothetical protein